MIPHIEQKQQYIAFIKARGVGERDKITEMPTRESYCHRLEQTSTFLNSSISQDSIFSLQEIDKIAAEMRANGIGKGPVADRKTAMRHYLAMLHQQKFADFLKGRKVGEGARNVYAAYFHLMARTLKRPVEVELAAERRTVKRTCHALMKKGVSDKKIRDCKTTMLRFIEMAKERNLR